MRARLVQMAIEGKLEFSEAMLAGFAQEKQQPRAGGDDDDSDDDEPDNHDDQANRQGLPEDLTRHRHGYSPMLRDSGVLMDVVLNAAEIVDIFNGTTS